MQLHVRVMAIATCLLSAILCGLSCFNIEVTVMNDGLEDGFSEELQIGRAHV